MRAGEASQGLSAYPWVYLRNGQPLKAGEKTVELAAVGDVMLGRGVSGQGDPFGEIAPWLRTAGLAFGNLECAIAPPGAAVPSSPVSAPAGQPFLLIAPASSVEQLSMAGFDLLSLANNHALDRGLQGLEQTASLLEAAQIVVAGAGAGPDLAYRPLIRRVGEFRLAFLAFNAVPSPRGPEWTGEVRDSGRETGWAVAGWDRERALAAVETARASADAVIVSIHWGYEYETRVDPAQREIAGGLVAAGADLVIGHHPHVVQAIERFPRPDKIVGEALVAYSLGNFVFDQGFEETRQGLALRAYFDRQGLRAVQVLPVLAGLRPRWMPPQAAGRLISRITPQPETLAWRCSEQECAPASVPPSSADGRFTAGEVDLSGDGAPESITLKAGRLRIQGAGFPDWESPTEWWVNDLAAGDPNRDGRQELLLALQKPDRSGVLLSHPFILGYRKGAVRLLWGGSAAGDPILEVELGDLDGDGWQELAVLEELRGGRGKAASLWRWNGWGFSQVWRSEPGQYQNLRLALMPEGDGSLLIVDQ